MVLSLKGEQYAALCDKGRDALIKQKLEPEYLSKK